MEATASLNGQPCHFAAKRPKVGEMVAHEGPMYVGKSSALVKAVHNAVRRGIRVHIMRHAADKRDQILGLKTHDGHHVINSDLISHGTYESPPDLSWFLENKISMIIVEEAQFFREKLPRLVRLLDAAANAGIDSHIAFLSGTFERKPWEGIDELRARCDKLRTYRGQCRYCPRKGSFSLALVNLTPGEIHPGSDEMYALVCRACYNERSQKRVEDARV